ncbi:hypothetical protein BM524_04495 [Alteromonas mediterranea]|uniref:DUF115 domain-containing protein n=1 Tax=Alteromonas mediterranea TaxID=314275 RepID=A0AAC9J830_9ALTE|nr:6-hydroxymethylpterin diphosphokinase MptE-like protein [Alteromonas mediterranea]APD89129.1 hypothetical protein BM524_04495 [Alteromonas mediterranea]
MLQQIQFHIHEDEQEQRRIEKSLALRIKENYRLSMEGLERYIPTLANLVKSSDTSVSTLLCNKFSELNIVNFNRGQVLYGMHPENEVLAHLNAYLSISPTILLPNQGGSNVSAFVSFGLGLGHHLSYVVKQNIYKHVIVYEPNIDYFICAISAIDWRGILQTAKANGIVLYLQVGSDASSFCRDIQELSDHVDVGKLIFYKHFNLPIFNDLEQYLLTGDWDKVSNWKLKREGMSFNDSYLSIWAPIRHEYKCNETPLNENKKEANLAALKKFFPDLYEEFVDYTPKSWEPVAYKRGEVSLVHIETGGLFSKSPLDDADISYNSFFKRPNKDGLLLSYTGKKLKSYLHYKLVDACEEVIKDVKETQSELPKQVKSLILFGIVSGYSIEKLTENHDIEMLFICEPNKDFFYASLYSIDWFDIFDSFNHDRKRLYLNIGDDGSNLTNDLLVQFQSVGPYILANTYFYQTYSNEKLSDAISELREQLLVIIAMGDYFDNAKYGIAHTRWALTHSVPFLLEKSKRNIPTYLLDVPVFIVGNGPSLDYLIEVLREEKERVVIVSCGTALQALYQNGITPDYHAEIETNRSTFDWLTRINDKSYLKKITLLSCNGIHPDSASLFSRTLLAFKQGEASTVSLTELDKHHPFELLDFSYPTVTNFAANIITALGFSQIYLIGTDLGFVSDSYHHSKSSGYYNGVGRELYSYAENHSMSLIVPGNFKPWVKTKYEFKVSKGVLEQAFARAEAEVYNLNDGARIVGTQPLRKDNVLISASYDEKLLAVSAISENAFSSKFNDTFLLKYEQRYNEEHLYEELSAFERLLSRLLVSRSDFESLVAEQREFIVESYIRKKSGLFYYFNGTINYINSMFSRLFNISDDRLVVEVGNRLLSEWRSFVYDAHSILKNDQYGVDNISSFTGFRRQIVLGKAWRDAPIQIEHINCPFVPKSALIDLATKSADKHAKKIVLNWLDTKNHQRIASKDSCDIVREIKQEHFSFPAKGLLLVSSGDYTDKSCPYQNNVYALMNSALLAISSGLQDAIFLQRFSEHPQLSLPYIDALSKWSKSFYCYAGPDFLVLTNEALPNEKLLLPSSDRLSYIPSLTYRDLRMEVISTKIYEERIALLNALMQRD